MGAVRLQGTWKQKLQQGREQVMRECKEKRCGQSEASTDRAAKVDVSAQGNGCKDIGMSA